MQNGPPYPPEGQPSGEPVQDVPPATVTNRLSFNIGASFFFFISPLNADREVRSTIPLGGETFKEVRKGSDL